MQKIIVVIGLLVVMASIAGCGLAASVNSRSDPSSSTNVMIWKRQ